LHKKVEKNNLIEIQEKQIIDFKDNFLNQIILNNSVKTLENEIQEENSTEILPT